MRRNRGLATWGHVDDDVVHFEDDFLENLNFSATALLARWLYASNDTNGVVALTADSVGGLLTLTPHTGDNDQVGIQLNHDVFQLRNAKRLLFRLKNVSLSSASLCGFFAGLAVEGDLAGVLGNDTANSITDAAGFLYDGTDLFGVSCKNASVAAWPTSTTGAKVDTGLALSTTATPDLAMEWDGAGHLHYYVNGGWVGTVTDEAGTKTLIPDDEKMSPVIVAQALSGAQYYAYVDKIVVDMER